MDEFEVTATPLDLSAALAGTGVFRVQNRGEATVYRAEWPTQPTPGVDARGWRHPVGSEVDIVVMNDANSPPTWVWTSSGSATLVVEAAVA